MNNKKYFLTPNEFSVISVGFGLSMVFGLKQIDGIVDNKEICMALHNMYVNDLIENKNNQGFIIDEEMSGMMKLIKQSKNFMSIEYLDGNVYNTISYYKSTEPFFDVVLEETCLNPDKIILYYSEWNAVKDTILEVSKDKEVHVRILDTQDGHIIKEEKLTSLQDADKQMVLDRFREEEM